MSRQRVPQSNDTEIDGLIEEILVAWSNREDDESALSDGTVRLLRACRNKIHTHVTLSPTERQKVEGIYAFFCR